MAKKVNAIINEYFFKGSDCKTLVVTAFETLNEIKMKNYILKPHKRPQICEGRYWLINKEEDSFSILNQLWRFIKDKYVLFIHFVYDCNSLIRSF